MIETTANADRGEEIARITDSDGDAIGVQRASTFAEGRDPAAVVFFVPCGDGAYATADDLRGLIDALEPLATPRLSAATVKPDDDELPGGFHVGDRVRTRSGSLATVTGRGSDGGLGPRIAVKYAVTGTELDIYPDVLTPEPVEASRVHAWGRIELSPPSVDPARLAAVQKARELLGGDVTGADLVHLASFLLGAQPWRSYTTPGSPLPGSPLPGVTS